MHAWQTLDLPQADIRSLYPCPLPAELSADRLLTQLQREVAWREEPITLFGKTVMQPRLLAWMGDDDASYTYSGLQLRPTPWSPLLAALRQHITALCQTQTTSTVRFNSVLLNLYHHGHDHMGLHSDDEPELGPQPCIASFSLGATRRFFLRHKTLMPAAKAQIDLHHGHLLLMQGNTQRYWKHGLRKISGAKADAIGPRINLTFRWIVA